MSFQLSDRIPKDNYYRLLREALDLRFIYSDTRDLYGSIGNPLIHPVIFRQVTRFKLMLTGYLENITSDRKLVEHCAMRMNILYFLGSGVGIVLTALVAMVLFKQVPDAPAILGMVLIIAGVLIMNIFSKASVH